MNGETILQLIRTSQEAVAEHEISGQAPVIMKHDIEVIVGGCVGNESPLGAHSSRDVK